MYLFFSFSLDTLSLGHWSCDHLVITNVIFIFDIYIYDDDDDDDDVINSPISPCVVSFLSLYTCFLFMYAIF